ncbi:O-antigen ligase family protein [Oryzomonas sagensis]|uniref:O-antigen ligase family protein n=1 Tax=Oryzomonas sagensis TaxID=2603857 RepID=A0ABQ6TKG8_9BACT|nr:O-antigen ligase family protein [Oryzomonas sagensis]KAB0668512.1 O-antigen ligase family protein [Oryzomonas sagensis]
MKNKIEITEYPDISLLSILLLCGYVVIWFLEIGIRVPMLGSIRFEFIYASILIVLSVLFTPKLNWNCPLFPYIGLYFFILVVSLPFSYDFDRSIDVFWDRIIKFACMAWFITCFVRSPRHLKFFLAAFLLACFKMGEEGFFGKITGSMMWENQGVMRLHGPTPIYEHPNSFSGMALGTLPFIYALWPISNKYIKITLLVLAIFSFNIIIYTGSRTGYVGFIFFMFFIMFNLKRTKYVLILIAFLSLSYLVVPLQYVERFNSIFTMKEKEGHSSEKRVEIMKDAIEIFYQHPFGVGIQAFPKVRSQYFNRSQDTHNLYLEVATNLGIHGLIIFLLLIYKMLTMLSIIKKNLARLLIDNTEILYNNFSSDVIKSKAEENIKDLKFLQCITTAVFAYIAIRLVLGFFGMDLYEIYWWLGCGVAISLYNINKIVTEKTSELYLINGLDRKV